MFKCEMCNSISEPKTSPIKVVLETRKKVYENQVRGRNEFKPKIIISEGWEIVKEVNACKYCAEARQNVN